MTDQELKDLVASLATAQVETDRQLRETGERIRALSEEPDRRQRETDRQIKELGSRSAVWERSSAPTPKAWRKPGSGSS